MEKALATMRRGHVELDASVDWPDGMCLEVSPVVKKVGMDESEWPTTPDGIAALLKRMDESEPLELSEEEMAASEVRRLAEKEHQKELTRMSWQQAENLF